MLGRHPPAHDREARGGRTHDRARRRPGGARLGRHSGRARGRARRAGGERAWLTPQTRSRSPSRRPIGVTPADPLCGGCLYAHIAYPRQLALKALVIADAFQRIARVPLPAAVPVAPSPEDGYRMRARLHVRGRTAGFFREGTHEVCDARLTRQLLTATSDALDRFLAALRSLGLDDVHEIELSENADASDRVVHLDTRRRVGARAARRERRPWVPTGGSSRSGVHDRRPSPTRSTLEGDASRPAVLRRHVLAFFQGNRFLLPSLVKHVVDRVAAGSECRRPLCGRRAVFRRRGGRCRGRRW